MGNPWTPCHTSKLTCPKAFIRSSSKSTPRREAAKVCALNFATFRDRRDTLNLSEAGDGSSEIHVRHAVPRETGHVNLRGGFPPVPRVPQDQALPVVRHGGDDVGGAGHDRDAG